mgnify:CR=1 FL=1
MDVFADHGHVDFTIPVSQSINDGFPFGKVSAGCIDTEFPDHDVV